MAKTVILTHLDLPVKGDFFAAKKLVVSLLEKGHSVEWLLKVEPDYELRPVAFIYSAIEDLKSFPKFDCLPINASDFTMLLMLLVRI